MNDRTRTGLAVILIFGFLLLLALAVKIFVFGNRIISPIPAESAIKIIFVTPTPIQSGSVPTVPSSEPSLNPSASPSVPGKKST